MIKDVKTILNELGVNELLIAMLILITGIVIFSLKNYDKSEYEIVLSNYFNKLLVIISKALPLYIIIFIIYIISVAFNNDGIAFIDVMFMSFIVISIIFFIHIIMVQSVGFTNIKYDYFIYIDENPKKKIIKLINNEIMIVENIDTHEIEFTTKWKDSRIKREVSNKGIFKELYDDLKYKKAIWLSSFLLIFTIILFGIGILSNNIGYTLIFIFLGFILILNVVSIWLNILLIKLEKKINRKPQT